MKCDNTLKSLSVQTLPGVYIFPVCPIPAPRQSYSDRWNPSKETARYRSWRDEIVLHANSLGFQLPGEMEIEFYLPVFPSWSRKKQLAMIGRPHTRTPDLDNCLKAFMDAFRAADSHVHTVRAKKLWDEKGWIRVTIP